jgi:hypothetical protein
LVPVSRISVRSKSFGLAVAAAAFVVAASATALAAPPPDPVPMPATPNVNGYPPVAPADFAVLGGAWYAFASPGGVTCMIDRGNANYGCSGPLPGAPDGADLVSAAGQGGAPTFSTTGGNAFAAAGPVKPLPPNTRLSFKSVSCATDAGGTTTCVNSWDLTGFVIGPGGSSTFGDTPPLLDRPSGTRPY